MTTTRTRRERDIAGTWRQNLRETLAPGQTVYVVTKHESSAGFYSLALYVVEGDKIAPITMAASRALGWPIDRHGGIRLQGGGMDMAHAIVQALAGVVFPETGFRSLTAAWL